jgi:hypothetical protein
VADIIDRVIAHERDRAGGLVDLHLDHVTAVRKGALAAVEGAALEQAGAHLHYFVFAAAAMKTYCSHMRFRSYIAVITAVFFVLSAVGQHVVAAGMAVDGDMEMQAPAMGMASPDDTTHCPAQSDCAKHTGMPAMACFAHCVTMPGFLSEPILPPASIAGHKLDLPVVNPLASLHGPPEPHPPKSLILI